MSLIAATQITAIATVVLALGAIITAWFAIKAFRKQTQEVALLQQQAERDIDQRRRAQASQVFLEVRSLATKGFVTSGDPPEPYGASAHNLSSLPVYQLSVIWTGWYEPGRDPIGRLISASELQPLANRLMPGKTTAARHTPEDAVPHPWLLFRDAAGVEWLTDTDGHLIEQAKGQFIEQAENPLWVRWHSLRQSVAALTGKVNSP
jgi:hypothetical protein